MGYIQDIQVQTNKRKFVQKKIINYLSNYLQKAETILDVGCGQGDFISQVEGTTLIALDIDPEAENYLSENIRFISGGIERLADLDSNSIDVIWASNFLEHLEMEGVLDFLKEAKRLIRVSPDSGYLILMQPNFRYAYRTYFDDFTHKTIFTDKSLVSVMKLTGFEVQFCEKRFLPYSLDSKKAKFSFLVGFYLKSKVRIFSGQMLIVAKPSTEASD
jgi:cyclopropane fatty-acyl-phospholipid synthase-like methyltransferase